MSGVSTGKKVNREVPILSLVVFVYFYIMLSVSAYRGDYALIGVFIELLTIPMLVTLAVLTIMSIVQMIKEKFSSPHPVYSFILLLAVIVRLMIM